MNSKYKHCPYCGEEILAEAKSADTAENGLTQTMCLATLNRQKAKNQKIIVKKRWMRSLPLFEEHGKFYCLYLSSYCSVWVRLG